MLILIAESKTMADTLAPISPATYTAHTPALTHQADTIINLLANLDAPTLAKTIKISPALAAKLRRQIYDYQNKTTGLRAIEAYTGVVFRAFDYPTLHPEARQTAQTNIRIISSLYGYLHPDDIIKPYRLDFTTPLPPNKTSIATYWRPTLTQTIIEDIHRGGHTHILNLLPADAVRCIDWKTINQHARTIRAEFTQIIDAHTTRTPNSTQLKKLRGYLLHQIIATSALSPQALITLQSDHYIASELTDDTLRLITA